MQMLFSHFTVIRCLLCFLLYHDDGAMNFEAGHFSHVLYLSVGKHREMTVLIGHTDMNTNLYMKKNAPPTTE